MKTVFISQVEMFGYEGKYEWQWKRQRKLKQ